MRPETRVVHAAAAVDPTSGAVSPAIVPSTTYERAVDGSFPHGNVYIREGNPNRRALEQVLAELEEGAVGIAFASGMAAANAIFQALAPGDHVVIPVDAYYGTPKLLRAVFVPWGLRVTAVDLTDLDALDAALATGARLVWVETPSNPLIRVTDIAAVVARAHATGALVAVDNTWATPLLQQPLTLGADLVLHSTTKYLGGHSDVQGGAVVVRAAGPLADRLRLIQCEAGAVPSPFDCWLVLRGIRTLAWRMRGHNENALAVATFLADHPAVEAVCYPGLPHDPGHAIASRQMRGFGGMLSFVVPGGRARAFAVAARLTLFRRATSLGGPESLIEHRASIEGPGTRAPEGLLRVSVGLEHPDDLIADLAQALAG